MDAAGLRILTAQPQIRVGAYAMVHLVVYSQTPVAETFRISDTHHRALRELYPGATALLTYVPAGVKMPDGAARRVAAILYREVATEIRCSATVIAGDGFWASAARSVLTGVQMISRPPSPNRAFAKIDDAAAWVCDHIDDRALESAGLADAMHALVAQA